MRETKLGMRLRRASWPSALTAALVLAGCGGGDDAGTTGAGGGGSAAGAGGGGSSSSSSSSGASSSGSGSVTVMSAGSKMIGSTSDKWPAITVDVAEGVESFMVSAASKDLAVSVGPQKVVAPDGTVLYDSTATGAQAFTAQMDGAGLPSAVLFPNTPDIKLKTGAYQVLLGSDMADTMVDVSVLVKKGDGMVKPSTLPVTFWFANLTFPMGAALNKDTAKTDPKFQQALGVFKMVYGNAQISVDLGAITYRDMKEVVGDAKATSWAVIPKEENLAAMYAEMNQYATAPGLHVYFIDQYTFMGGDGTLGISGGIPGPSAFEGVAHSGVSCGVAALYGAAGGGLDPADDFGATIAHEGGHYLGLFHTTEQSGMSYDPISDTPECTGVDGMGQHAPESCGGMGNDNFMFWQSSNMLQTVVSPGQSYVLQMNPSVNP